LRKKALEDRVAVLGGSSSWPQIIADSLGETEIEHNGKSFVVRSALGPAARPRTTSPGGVPASSHGAPSQVNALFCGAREVRTASCWTGFSGVQPSRGADRPLTERY
jgi:hypothetical protein